MQVLSFFSLSCSLDACNFASSSPHLFGLCYPIVDGNGAFYFVYGCLEQVFAIKEDSEVFGLWAAGSLVESGGHVFDDKNSFDVYFPDHLESAGEAPVSPEAEAESKTQHVVPVVTAADFVHEFVPAEGHMINPITGGT